MSWYRTGTVAVTNGQTTVTGTGTLWVANVLPGQGIVLPDGRIYEVAGVVSNTQITLAIGYLGATASGQAYTIVPTRGVLMPVAQAITEMVAQYGEAFLGAGQGRFGDGTLAAPALRFTADENTGFFRPGNEQIGAVTNGVLRWLLSNTAFQVNVPITGAAVTQSVTDTTAGRLLKVGDFGLGTDSAVSSPGDLNDLRRGQISVPVSQANSPAAEIALWSAGRSGGARASQFAVDHGRPARAWFRGYNSGRAVGQQWSDWQELYHRLNILGICAQSAGIPTGAIIERGGNANGEFVRFADGTQICWSPDITITTNVSDNAMLSAFWTFPAAFSVAPNVLPTLRVNGTVFSGFGSLTVSQIRQLLGAPTAQNGVSSTTAEILVCFGQLAPVGAQMTGQRAIAVGRWF